VAAQGRVAPRAADSVAEEVPQVAVASTI